MLCYSRFMFALVMLSLQPCSVDVYLLFNVLPIVCGSSMFVFVLLCITCVHSSCAIILKRKRKLVALLLLFCRCIVTMALWFCGSSSRCRGMVCSL